MSSEWGQSDGAATHAPSAFEKEGLGREPFTASKSVLGKEETPQKVGTQWIQLDAAHHSSGRTVSLFGVIFLAVLGHLRVVDVMSEQSVCLPGSIPESGLTM